MKKIKITLHRDGTQKLEVLDASGPECVPFTEELEKRLGTPDGERKLKKEYEREETEREPEHEVEK